MAQVKLLKIASDGVPLEMDTANDDITLKSYSVAGGGPVLSATGLDMNATDVTDISDLVFTDPTTGTINQTAGSLIVDNIMAKERNNAMTASSGILFPVVTDIAGEVDAFKIPHIAGAPSATPAFSSDAGYLVYDATNKSLYAWDGSAWDNLNTVSVASNLDASYTAGATIAARDICYISAADTVSPAKADAVSTSYAIGFATAGAAAASPVNIRKGGTLAGFTGLTAGARYYVSAATAGQITSTLPNGAGHSIVMVGYAKSTTEIDIQFQNLGRRAS